MAQSPGDGKLLRTAPCYHNIYTTKFSLGKNYQGSDTYVVGACHLLWPIELRALYDSPGRQRGHDLAP